MSYKLHRYIWPETGAGEYWRGDTFKEHLAMVHYQIIKGTILEYLPKTGKILEAGCGIGKWLIYLRQLGYDVIGIEISQEALQTLTTEDKSVPVVLADVENTCFTDESFESIISLGVMEHFENGPQICLRETRRLLKKDGILLLTVPYQNLIRQIVLRPAVWFAGSMLKRLGFQPQFSEYRFSKKTMLKFLNDFGFEVIRVEPDDYIYPKSLGLYADWGKIIGDKHKMHELNRFGKILQRILGLFPLWFYCEGILLVARKR